MFGFTEEQIRRYSRQIILPDVGGKGQRKLLESRVLLIGAGGLGSPAGLYLAAAGVGTLGFVDFDVVDISNLHRQILHTTEDVGRSKTQSAAETVQAINPDVEVIHHPVKLTAGNVGEIFADYDVIIDGSDNFPAKYLANDACVMLGKPLVLGAVFQFEGQATVFVPGEGPCYRCLSPTPPPPGSVPSCQEAGVFGAVPGVRCYQNVRDHKRGHPDRFRKRPGRQNHLGGDWLLSGFARYLAASDRPLSLATQAALSGSPPFPHQPPCDRDRDPSRSENRPPVLH